MVVNSAPLSNDLYTTALELVEEGDVNAFKTLLATHAMDPNSNECEFLRLSILHNQAEIFAYLLPFYNKDLDNSDVLCEACSLNHTVFALQLIAHTNPTANQNEPLMWAARHNNQVLMDTLLPLSNPWEAMEQVERYAHRPRERQGLLYLRNYVYECIGTQNPIEPRKKI